jgi:hypothetical protein
MILVFGRLYVNREEICRQKQVVRTGFFFKNDTEIHGPACREAGESRSYTERIIRKSPEGAPCNSQGPDGYRG